MTGVRLHEDGHIEHVADASRRKHVGGWALGRDRSVLHDDDVVGVLGSEVEIVQDHENADAVGGEGSRGLQHVVLVGEIEAGRGLVEQEVAVAVGRRRPDLGEPAGEVHTLLFTAGERRERPLDEVTHPHGVERMLGDLPVAPRLAALQMRRAAHEHDL